MFPNDAVMEGRKIYMIMNNARLPNLSNVGGASGAENVKNLWLHHYQFLLNSTPTRST